MPVKYAIYAEGGSKGQVFEAPDSFTEVVASWEWCKANHKSFLPYPKAPYAINADKVVFFEFVEGDYLPVPGSLEEGLKMVGNV